MCCSMGEDNLIMRLGKRNSQHVRKLTSTKQQQGKSRGGMTYMPGSDKITHWVHMTLLVDPFRIYVKQIYLLGL